MLINNQDNKLKDVLLDQIKNADEITIAVAFFKTSGYKEIRKALEGKKVTFIVGLDFFQTEPDALEQVLKDGHSLYLPKETFGGKTFHPKIYLFEQIEEENNEKIKITKAVIGSSNMTSGGLGNNLEISVLLNSKSNGDKIEKLKSTIESYKSEFIKMEKKEDFIPYSDDYKKYNNRYKQIKKEIYTSPRETLSDECLNRPKKAAKTDDSNKTDFLNYLLGEIRKHELGKLLKFENNHKGNNQLVSRYTFKGKLSNFFFKFPDDENKPFIELWIDIRHDKKEQLYIFLEKRKKDIKAKFGPDLVFFKPKDSKGKELKSNSIRWTYHDNFDTKVHNWENTTDIMIDKMLRLLKALEAPLKEARNVENLKHLFQ